MVYSPTNIDSPPRMANAATKAFLEAPRLYLVRTFLSNSAETTSVTQSNSEAFPQCVADFVADGNPADVEFA